MWKNNFQVSNIEEMSDQNLSLFTEAYIHTWWQGQLTSEEQMLAIHN